MPRDVAPARIVGHEWDDRDTVDRVERAVEASVERHLASDAPLTVLCSGGVDSGLVSAFTKRRLPSLEAYVVDIGGPASELPRAQAVADHLGMTLHAVRLTPEAFQTHWRDAVRAADGPLHSPNTVALLAVVRRCRDDGYKVVLTGEGADELFGGYAWHRQTHRQWCSIEGWRGWLKGRRRREARRRLLERMPFASPIGLSAGRRSAPPLDADAMQPRRILNHLSPIEPASDRALLAHGLHDLSAHLGWLLHRHDRMGMAASLEMRVPFLSAPVIDLALHLPARMKLRRGVGKWALKEVARRHLPRSVIDAPKLGFVVPPTHTHGAETLLREGRVAGLLELGRDDLDMLIGELTQHPDARFQLASLEMWLAEREGSG